MYSQNQIVLSYFVIYKQGIFPCFRISVLDITALASVDYVPSDEVLQISSFIEASQYPITLTIIDDDVLEGTETMEFEFSIFDDEPSSGNLIAGPAITTVVIVDDDAPRKYSNAEIYSRYNS